MRPANRKVLDAVTKLIEEADRRGIDCVKAERVGLDEGELECAANSDRAFVRWVRNGTFRIMVETPGGPVERRGATAGAREVQV